ncbi:MAG TPA: dihydrodipicolinate synthase family protein [Thermomicrobiales bacterium]|nr:dihydrodipicolinate synthase family protein [Thermomicrobiales bacterium]
MTITREMLLPRADGTLEAYAPAAPSALPAQAAPPRTRLAFAAAHVVPDPLADNDPWLDVTLDWEATLAYRRHLWGLGFSIAEAMDTAQRGMGLDWTTTQEVIRRALAEARAVGAADRIACGAGTDHLAPRLGLTVDDVIAAYEEQCAFVEGEGGRIILMASRALAACAQGPDDYARVYSRILSQVAQPVIIHWLGDMFDPALAGYWGAGDLDAAMESALRVIADNAAKIDGVKISLLDDQREIAMRRRLPDGVRMYTGDDFNYPALIKGDEQGYSDALLGIFDAIAPAASAALHALDAGDLARYDEIFAPTVALSRHIFKAPTRFYKTGVVFMAYLNGHQAHFHMVGGQESARSVVHLAELFRLADRAGLLADPDLAVARMRHVLALAGIE